MLRMFQRMKSDLCWVVLIFVLLVSQAYSDLALPSYTSKIVDVGIQQGGIEDAVPERIRATSLEKLFYVSSPEDGQMIKDSYEVSEDPDIYVLGEITSKEREQLSDLMSRSEMILSLASQQGVDVMEIPADQKDLMLESAAEMLEEYPESMTTQAAILFVKEEYTALGMDLDEIQTSYIRSAGLRMIGMAMISMLCAIFVTLIASRVAAKLGRDLRREVYAKVLTFSSHEMNKFSTASLITRSTNDVQQVQMVVTMLFRIVIYAPILAVGGIVRVMQTGSYLSWILIVGVAVLLSMMFILFRIVSPKFRILQSKIDRVNLISRETLTGVSVIRAFSNEKHEEERFEDANKDLTNTNLFVNRVMAMMMPLMTLIMNGITVLIVYNGAYGINEGKLQVGDMMAFITYAMQIIMSFLMIAAVAIFLPRANVSAGRINEILDTEPMIGNPENTKQPNDETKGQLEFRDVSFAYPGAEEKVLNHISFTAKPGQTVAFIGSTGSGKSTLVNLIPRFYDVTEGSILIDGVDVRDMDLKELRSRLGFVPQKSILFSGTIASNLRFGKEDASEEEMRNALDIAQASDFVFEKKDGIDSSISQGGANVSGGQKQRLAIARAIAKQPEFYIFDDSFSALDFKTDAKLRRTLKEKTKEVTTLIVAQRVSTIMQADLILVLDEGRVVGEGTHKELLASCEEYRQIAESQLSADELA